MFTLENVENFKNMAPILIDVMSVGTIFVVTDHERIIWKAAGVWDFPQIAVGNTLRADGAISQAIKSGKTATEKIPRKIYGSRFTLTAIPITDGDSVVGGFAVYQPRMHPVALSFPSYAPMVGEMFAEGAIVYVTDLERYGNVYNSKKFALPESFAIGSPLPEDSVAKQTINTARPVTKEFPASVHGVPVMIMSYPMLDEDDSTKVVGSFGMVLPRETAVKLRFMSGNLKEGLLEISAATEELASSATQISGTELQLNQNVSEVYQLSENINEILVFIRQIADETKMLGLNAAIEAARAGEAGRGFGVVAEEIRKLSDESKETVVKIHALTNSIKEKIRETTEGSESTLRAAEEQAATSEEITARVQEITSLADQLDNIANEM